MSVLREARGQYDSVWLHLMDFPFRYGGVKAAGVETRYIQAGPEDAPPLIMLHGTAGSLETFCANLGAHAKHFNCFAFDLVGNGFSERPAVDLEIPVYTKHVLGFMDAMNIPNASFIGCSLGAWIACRLAVDQPDRVKRLVLVAPAGAIVNRDTMSEIKSKRSKAVEEPTWDNMKDVLRPLFFHEEDILPDFIGVRQKSYLQPGMKVAMERILILQDPEVRTRNLITPEDWTKIKAPTLFIAVPDDKGDYYTTAVEAPKLMAKGFSTEIREARHWPHFEAADEFNRKSIAFLLGAEAS